MSLLQPVSVSIGATPASARVPGQALRPPGRSQASRSFKAPARHWTTRSPAPGSGGGTRLLGARRRSVHSWMAAAAFSLSGGFLRVFRHHWLGTRAYQPPRSSRWCQARALTRPRRTATPPPFRALVPCPAPRVSDSGAPFLLDVTGAAPTAKGSCSSGRVCGGAGGTGPGDRGRVAHRDDA